MHAHTRDSEILFPFTDPALVIFPEELATTGTLTRTNDLIGWKLLNGEFVDHVILLGHRGWYRSTNRLASKTEGNGGPRERKTSRSCAVSGYNARHSVVQVKLDLANVSHLSTT